MMKVIEQRLKFGYENNASASYLAVMADDTLKIKKYQIEMIGCNTINGILSVDIRNKNNEKFLYYDITSKQVLAQFLTRKKLTKAEFTGILSDIVSVMLKSSAYLLSEKGFLLHEDYIYINPLTMETYLIYLPFDTESEQFQGLKEFVVKLIVKLANIDEKESDNFLQRILTFVRQENFNLSGFYKLLNELKETKEGNKESLIIPGKKPDLKQDRPKVLKQIYNSKNSNEVKSQEMKIQIPGRPALPLEFPGGKQKQLQNSQAEDAKSTKDETIARNPNIVLMAALLQVLVIIGVILVAGYLKQVTHDNVSAYGGTAIILFSVDFMVLRKLMEKDNSIQKAKKNETGTNMEKPNKLTELGRKLDMSKREIRNEPEKNINLKNELFTSREPEDHGTQNFYENFSSDSLMKTGPIADETALLDMNMLKYPQLQRHSNGMLESISITKPNFVIGRLREQVDYVLENNSVGKIHAEIISREGEYYLVDLNSKNGTYINGTRIPSNKEQVIHNNDRITIANAEYIFSLSVN